ncbi:AsmA family protein [Kistimonas asteriae]|uniref:AsmA family protein n=1 Tax=Kistimonas asteriae TaxID=517724 RepID=UPI001BABDB49|nr:AsmA family protein [Kistimonas asteriae]
MKTLFKWLTGIVVSLIVLVILAAVLLPVVINPNDYREQLRSAVSENTGYDLHLNGTINWSLFPRLGLSVADIQVDDIHNQPLATLKQADIHVALLPLILNQRVDMQALVLDGLTLNLSRDTQGKPNWIEPEGSASTAATASEPTQTEPSSSKKTLSLNIASVDISQINLNYQDQQTGQSLLIHNAHLQTDAIQAGQPFNLKAGFSLQSSEPPLHAAVSLETALMLNLRNNTFKADQIDLTITPEQHKEPVKLTITATLEGNDGQLDGNLTLEPVNFQRFLQQLGMPLPEMGNPKALTKVSLTTTVNTADNRASLQDVNLVLDDFTMSGKLAVTDISSKALRFTLKGSDLQLDDYLPLVPAEPSTEISTSTQDQPTTEKSTVKNASNAPVIPVDLLKPLNLEGKLSLSALTVKGFRFDKPTLAVKANNGVLSVSKLNAGFYDGVIDGKAKIDVNGIPQLSTRSTIQDIDLHALSEAVPDLQAVTGKTNASIRLLTRGLTEPELIQHLNGVIEFHVDNGALHGVNLNKTVCSGIAKIRKKPISKADWPDETQFTSLKGTLNISDGVATNNNLCAAMDQLNLCGGGTINLVKQSLDYTMGVTVTGSTAEEDEPACRINEKYADLTWPIRCSGKIGDSDLCGIDEQRLGELAATVAERELKGKLQQKLDDKLRNKFGDQLGEELGDKLKNLFQ